MLALSIITMAQQHPTLPTMWTAFVREEQVGDVLESENFVFKGSSADNPSAKWTSATAAPKLNHLACLAC